MLITVHPIILEMPGWSYLFIQVLVIITGTYYISYILDLNSSSLPYSVTLMLNNDTSSYGNNIASYHTSNACMV